MLVMRLAQKPESIHSVSSMQMTMWLLPAKVSAAFHMRIGRRSLRAVETDILVCFVAKWHAARDAAPAQVIGLIGR